MYNQIYDGIFDDAARLGAETTCILPLSLLQGLEQALKADKQEREVFYTTLFRSYEA